MRTLVRIAMLVALLGIMQLIIGEITATTGTIFDRVRRELR